MMCGCVALFDAGLDCDECYSGVMLVRRARATGHTFWGCSNYHITTTTTTTTTTSRGDGGCHRTMPYGPPFDRQAAQQLAHLRQQKLKQLDGKAKETEQLKRKAEATEDVIVKATIKDEKDDTTHKRVINVQNPYLENKKTSLNKEVREEVPGNVKDDTTHKVAAAAAVVVQNPYANNMKSPRTKKARLVATTPERPFTREQGGRLDIPIPCVTPGTTTAAITKTTTTTTPETTSTVQPNHNKNINNRLVLSPEQNSRLAREQPIVLSHAQKAIMERKRRAAQAKQQQQQQHSVS